MGKLLEEIVKVVFKSLSYNVLLQGKVEVIVKLKRIMKVQHQQWGKEMHLLLSTVVFHQNKLKFMIYIGKILLKKKILNFTIGKENKLVTKILFYYLFHIINHNFDSKWWQQNNHNIWYLPNIQKIYQMHPNHNQTINFINNKWVILLRTVFQILLYSQDIIFKAWSHNIKLTKIFHNI